MITLRNLIHKLDLLVKEEEAILDKHVEILVPLGENAIEYHTDWDNIVVQHDKSILIYIDEKNENTRNSTTNQ